MDRIILTLLLMLALAACSVNTGREASVDEWKQWQSYLDQAEAQPEQTQQFADSALIFARSHEMTDTGCYRPWELKARAARRESLTDEAVIWMDSVRLTAADRGHEPVEARALIAIGQLYMMTGEWQLAELPFRDALELTDDSGLDQEKSFALLAWSSFLRRSGKLIGAIDTLELAAGMFGKAGNLRFVGHSLHAQGEIYLDGKDTLKAESNFRAAITAFSAKPEDKTFASRTYGQLSALSLKRNTDSALFYFNAALAVDPTHQFPAAYFNNLMLLGNHYIRAQQPGSARPFIDSAIAFSKSRKNKQWESQGLIRKAIVFLQTGDKLMFDSMMRGAVFIAMEGNRLSEFEQELRGWQDLFKGTGQQNSATQLAAWADPKQFIRSGNIPVVQPQTIREIPASRRASIRKKQNMRLAIGLSAFLLVSVGIWRIVVYRRNNAFLTYRERSEKMAADRKYRRDVLADTNNNPASEANRLVLERECRVLAMEQLFEQERLHLQPDTNFTEVCKRLGENERSFRSVIADMYDADFEKLLDEWKVEEAIRQLREGTKVSAVSQSCGFRDEQTFRRTFRKITGVTPARFLKMPFRPIR